ncbi:uncharacterized protein [Nicotiana tomentosiformis]|uniref:uncharacterized protein n=1 Tax=Nicotiana tomentosiformis TaxID=4098 RepID=UPI00388C5F81
MPLPESNEDNKGEEPSESYQVPRYDKYPSRGGYAQVNPGSQHPSGIHPESLGAPVYVSTPVGNFIVVDWIYRSCIMTFYGYETRTDLLLLDMTDFKVILGMDWLSPYHFALDCHAKTVTLAMPELPRLEWKDTPLINSVLVVWEFTYAFPSNLSGMPPDRDINFCIDLAPGYQGVL